MDSEENTRPPESRAHVVELVAIGVIASIIGIALGLLIDWFPTQATEEGKQIDTLWDVLIIFSVPVFVLVMVIVLYCVWRFRMRPGDELRDGPPIHGNTRLEIIWTAIPAIVLVALCSYAYVVLTRRRGGRRQRARRPRRRPAVHLDVLLQGPVREDVRLAAALRADRPPGQVHGPVRRRDPRLLGPGLPAQDRRGAGDQHVAARHAGEGRRVPGRLRGAVRASATPRCARPPTWSSRRSSRPSWSGAAAPRLRRRPSRAAPRPTASRCSPRRAAAAATRSPTPARPAAPGLTSTRCCRTRAAAFIEQSIVDPNAEIAPGFSAEHHARPVRPDAPAGGTGRAREVP